jgi:3-isopropylmalate/(R)-2-methylmalate dehydratase small subunit
MKPFVMHRGIVAPLDRANVDTDAIIPKQFLKSIKRSGFGPNLFDHWRHLDQGDIGVSNANRRLNPEFVLNQERYREASILLARKNFGCGSSREHAVWALLEAGFRTVLAPSYSDIFYTNCFKNGFLPIVLKEDVIDRLFGAVSQSPGYSLDIDLQTSEIRTPDGEILRFEISDFRRHCLLVGLDEIGLTLEKAEQIRAYEARRRQQAPWLFTQPRRETGS